MNIVPFTQSEAMGGFAECRGLLKHEGNELILEMQMQDGFVGVLKSPVQEIRIPIDDVVSLEITKGWLGTNIGVKIVLQTSNVELLAHMPGASQGRVRLQIARADVEDARTFVSQFYGESVYDA